jgi:hypothetical protein
MADKIDLNTAGVGELTQLPGIAKNMAYKIVNHRARHGMFTDWEELREINNFPMERLEEIRGRAKLTVPPDAAAPRNLKSEHLNRVAKKPAGYTRKIRSTRRSDKMQQTRGGGRKAA